MKQQQNYPGIYKMCLFCAVHITGDIKNFVQISILLNKPKELSFYHKLWFSNSNNFATRFPKPLILLAFNSIKKSKFEIWKVYTIRLQRYRVRKCDFMAKSQFLCQNRYDLRLYWNHKKSDHILEMPRLFYL